MEGRKLQIKERRNAFSGVIRTDIGCQGPRLRAVFPTTWRCLAVVWLLHQVGPSDDGRPVTVTEVAVILHRTVGLATACSVAQFCLSNFTCSLILMSQYSPNV
jgi:hypothetical protein